MTPEALRALIAELGLSQVEFARTVAGVDPRTVRLWLAGTHPVPASLAKWLASASIAVRAGAVLITVPRMLHPSQTGHRRAGDLTRASA